MIFSSLCLLFATLKFTLVSFTPNGSVTQQNFHVFQLHLEPTKKFTMFLEKQLSTNSLKVILCLMNCSACICDLGQFVKTSFPGSEYMKFIYLNCR